VRTAFINTLIELARSNERIFLLVGDLGYSVVEPFAREFPRRFVNIGVAEQNMTGIAAGLALSGKIVFTYSIANFPTLRCLEQIRNDVCYHNANVKIVAVGGGVAYGAQGMTHHATEDIAIMRVLPNMTVLAPGDPVETALAVQAIIDWPGPCYLRLGKAGEPLVHKTTPEFQVGKALLMREGSDMTLISTGGMLYNTMQAAERLVKEGINTKVLSMTTIKPLDVEAVLAAAKGTLGIVTVEEHSIIGGLGGAIAETLTALRCERVPLQRLGLPDAFSAEIGGQEYLRHLSGLSVDGICHSVKLFWNYLRK
jgi:transketolase